MRSPDKELAAIVQSSDDAIVGADLDGTITQWNRAAEQMYGYEAREVIGQPVSILATTEGTAEQLDIFARLRRGENIEHHETVRKRKNGTIVDVSITLSPVKDALGNMVGISAIARDITERKHRESLLAAQYAATRAKTEELQAVFDAMAVFLQGGSWSEASSCFLHSAMKQTGSEYGMVGVPNEGRALRIIAFDSIRPNQRINMKFVEQTLCTFDRPGRIKNHDFTSLVSEVMDEGRTLICNQPSGVMPLAGLSEGHPALDNFLGVPMLKGTEVTGMMGLANRPGGYTESEQKKVEMLAQLASVLSEAYKRQASEAQLKNQLVENACRLEKIIASCSDAFIAIDESGNITDWNAQSERIFGWSSPEAIGQELALTIIPEQFRQAYRIKLFQCLNKQEVNIFNQRIEFTALHRDGHEFPIEFVVFPVTLGGKQIFCAFIRDIADQKSAQKTARQLLLLQEREDFMFTLTHDLKNPLIGSNRVLEQLARGEFGMVPSEPVDVLLKLRDSNTALIALIRNIIEVYRYEKDANSLDLAEIDLGELILECTGEFARAGLNRGIEIKTRALPAVSTVLADANSIRRLLHNLLDNAIKFSPDGGTVTVSLQVEGQEARVEIHNAGESIAPADREFLFQRFFQGTRGKKYVAGSGLGLYLCHKIVNAHNGTITYSGEDGSGSIFSVKLPLSQVRELN